MVGIDLALISNQIMPPNFKGVHYGCKFQVMGRIVLLMRPELAGSLRNNFPVLHQYTTQSLSGCVAINDKALLIIWQN